MLIATRFGETADQGFSTVSSTAFAVDLTSLPTPRTVLAQAERAKAQAIMAIGAMRNSFMSGVSLNNRFARQQRRSVKLVP
ncbi:hypothetical protein MES5069_70361 [Mesorhizobium escarrei]|uniref:Uncharacterized protein n=1 Tax=Mesorhizobium escarrei TaxID=666018 RepID=A0ABN8KJ03_9HYPH|nr:hypothetical protein MES5069_70361 [Mesorhizobium escarrei]